MGLHRDDSAFFPETAAATPDHEPDPPQAVSLSSALTLEQLAGMVAAYFSQLTDTEVFTRQEALTLAQSMQAAVVASLAMGEAGGDGDGPADDDPT